MVSKLLLVLNLEFERFVHHWSDNVLSATLLGHSGRAAARRYSRLQDRRDRPEQLATTLTRCASRSYSCSEKMNAWRARTPSTPNAGPCAPRPSLPEMTCPPCATSSCASYVSRLLPKSPPSPPCAPPRASSLATSATCPTAASATALRPLLPAS
eukprot:6214091-Pleurochrysis_carterae.AAC.2